MIGEYDLNDDTFAPRGRQRKEREDVAFAETGNWRNHVPENVRAYWLGMGFKERAIVVLMALHAMESS